MAKHGQTKSGLFGNTPGEARRQIDIEGKNQDLTLARLPRGRGVVALASQAGRQVGGVINKARGVEDPRLTKATQMQRVQELTQMQADQAGVNIKDNPQEYLGLASKNFADAGLTDKALQTSLMINQLKAQGEERKTKIANIQSQIETRRAMARNDFIRARAYAAQVGQTAGRTRFPTVGEVESMQNMITALPKDRAFWTITNPKQQTLFKNRVYIRAKDLVTKHKGTMTLNQATTIAVQEEEGFIKSGSPDLAQGGFSKFFLGPNTVVRYAPPGFETGATQKASKKVKLDKNKVKTKGKGVDVDLTK